MEIYINENRFCLIVLFVFSTFNADLSDTQVELPEGAIAGLNFILRNDAFGDQPLSETVIAKLLSGWVKRLFQSETMLAIGPVIASVECRKSRQLEQALSVS